MVEQKTTVQTKIQEEKERLFLEARNALLNRITYTMDKTANSNSRVAVIEATDLFAKYGFDAEDLIPSVVMWLEKNDYTTINWFIVEEQKCIHDERITTLELVRCLFAKYYNWTTINDVLDAMGLYALVIPVWKTAVILYRIIKERDLVGE